MRRTVRDSFLTPSAHVIFEHGFLGSSLAPVASQFPPAVNNPSTDIALLPTHMSFQSLRWLVLTVVLALSALYTAGELKRGWRPWDEGYLGQTAERVLHGELPHRDFDEGYTGGLTYLNAVAFRLFGTNLASLRYMLFLFFLCWVPAVFYAASRFVSAPLAGVTTLLAVVWSVPNYPAALPSWYNLFFATFGIAALFRYLETQSRRWLFLAGLCGGISFLFKLSGLYFVAGVVLFLLFRERLVRVSEPASQRGIVFYRIFLVASVVVYELLVIILLRKAANLTAFLYFWVPDLAIGATILWQEFRSTGSPRHRPSIFFRELLLVGAGFALPLAIFLVPYVLTGALLSFYHAIFVTPARQFVYASYTESLRRFVTGSFANLLFIAAVFCTRPKVANALGVLFLLGVAPLLLLIRAKPDLYKVAWCTVWTFLPLSVVIGLALLIRPSMLGQSGAIQQQQTFLVLSITGACNLVQFPFTVPIYFCYVAPLALLSAAAILGGLRLQSRWGVLAAICFCLLFAIFEYTPGFIEEMGNRAVPDTQVARLALPRAAGLRVYPAEARTYEELNLLVKEHARGEYIYATPDCPEVYFLYGFRNPTQTSFEYRGNSSGRTERVLTTIHEHNINLVVLNRDPTFSGPVPADLRAALEREFPNRAQAGNFEVRWKP